MYFVRRTIGITKTTSLITPLDFKWEDDSIVYSNSFYTTPARLSNFLDSGSHKKE